MTSPAASKPTKEVFMSISKICSIDGCKNKHIARGWCSAHYKRWRVHGDPAVNIQNEQRNVAGRQYGYLVAIERTNKNAKDGSYYWKLKCVCGNMTEKVPCALRDKASCGCVASQIRANSASSIAKKYLTTHGLSGQRVYRCWSRMLQRCKPTYFESHLYFDRGIRVCDRWKKFENFYKDIGNPPTDEHSLDRIDVDGSYEPGNVRWATHKQQARNKRNTVRVSWDGRQVTIGELSEELGIKYGTIMWRLKNNRKLDSSLWER